MTLYGGTVDPCTHAAGLVNDDSPTHTSSPPVQNLPCPGHTGCAHRVNFIEQPVYPHGRCTQAVSWPTGPIHPRRKGGVLQSACG
mmetsp:Transcript_117775/g.205067  ORF Transcript_117775/g.205067 Transcript_117775/m.205067 type:complete len:85 (+) Transcript_117775:163-417(+)